VDSELGATLDISNAADCSRSTRNTALRTKRACKRFASSGPGDFSAWMPVSHSSGSSLSSYGRKVGHMNFSALGSAWLFALLIPLIIFYFLKLRRPRQTVSSLVLWRQVLSDQRVNSPFQRFKRNLLLLLQILLLALLAFAAMQPFLRRESTRTDRLPILVDVSASMGALDKDGGRSRLEEARARLRERIDALSSDQELCIVSFAKTARKLTGFTNNKSELRDAVDALQVEGRAGANRRCIAAGAGDWTHDAIRSCSRPHGRQPASARELRPAVCARSAEAACQRANAGITACQARRGRSGIGMSSSNWRRPIPRPRARRADAHERRSGNRARNHHAHRGLCAAACV
jgi:hypothetical protein